MSFEFLLMDKLDYLERFGRWQWLKTPLIGISGSEFGALIMQVDWMHAIPAAALAITAFGSAFLGLLRAYKLNQIEEWRRKELARAEIDAIRSGKATPIDPGTPLKVVP